MWLMNPLFEPDISFPLFMFDCYYYLLLQMVFVCHNFFSHNVWGFHDVVSFCYLGTTGGSREWGCFRCKWFTPVSRVTVNPFWLKIVNEQNSNAVRSCARFPYVPIYKLEYNIILRCCSMSKDRDLYILIDFWLLSELKK